MTRTIFVFIFILASAWLGVFIAADPGYLLISYQDWTVETSLLFSLFVLFALLFILSLTLTLLKRLLNLPCSLRQFFERRRRNNAQQTTRQGLIEYSEGYWKQAKKHLTQALNDTDTPLLNYLTAARASQNLGDSKARDQYLREAQQSMPEAKIAVKLTQAELQIANQQWEQALATLKHLQELAPNHPYVLKLLMELYEKVNDWPQLIQLLPALHRNKILLGARFEAKQLDAYHQAIKNLIRLKDNEALEELFSQLPKALIYSPVLNQSYAEFLIAQERYQQAERLLKDCLRKELSDDLLLLYGLCNFQPKQQLTFLESFQKKGAQSAAFYLALGRLCILNQLWGKAKQSLQQSIELKASANAHLALGQLYEQLNEQAKAQEHYKSGLLLALLC